MTDKVNKITVKATGPFELRDVMQNLDIGMEPVEVLETSFVTQMIGLKRLEITEGKAKQEWDPNEFNQNPSVGEALPVKDEHPTLKELTESTTAKRGRPASTK